MSDSPKNDNSDLDDLLAAYNIAVTDGSSSGTSGGGGVVNHVGDKSTDRFLEPPAAKRSKRKNYVPHKPRHFLGEGGEEPDERKSPSPSERTTTPTPTSSRGSSRGPTPTPGSSTAASDANLAEGPVDEDGAATSSSAGLISASASGGFNVSELRRHLQDQSRLQPSSAAMTTLARPTIEPSEIYVAPNQPSISVSHIRSMAPSAATQLLNQQRKMAAAAKVAQQQQQFQQQQPTPKRSAPAGSTIVSVGAPVMLIPVTGASVMANSARSTSSALTASQVCLLFSHFWFLLSISCFFLYLVFLSFFPSFVFCFLPLSLFFLSFFLFYCLSSFLSFSFLSFYLSFLIFFLSR